MIPVNKPLLSSNEKQYLFACLESGWISGTGHFVQKFEKEFSAYVGRNYGIAVSSGSGALDIALKAIGISDGDEVIMPAFTIISPAVSVVRQGAVPVLLDSCPDTWNMNVDEIKNKITGKTKAIIVVHIYGLPVDIEPVLEIAQKYNLKVVEDAAEMHGQTYKGKKCGSFGDISIFSFYSNKHITTGEGGMVVTDDESLAEHCRSLKNLCFLPDKRFVHEELGWNYRMTNLQAAIGVAQLEAIEKHLIRKREIGNLYNNLLSDINGLDLPLKRTEYAENIYWVYGLVVNKMCRFSKDNIVIKLTEKGIETRPFFCPMHLQPVFKKKGLFLNESYPVSEHLYLNGFYIPSGLGIENNEIMTVSEKLHEILT